jgi:acid phosphatase type 7
MGFGQFTVRTRCAFRPRSLSVVAAGWSVATSMLVATAQPALANAQSQSQLAKGPYVTGVTATAAQVRAEAKRDEPMSLEVRVFGDAAGAPIVVTDKEIHAGPRVLQLNGLQPDTRYKYQLKAGGAVENGEFVTAPADDREFSFIAYGDNRTDDAAHAAIVAAMQKAPGNFLVHTGDFVPVGSNPEDWQKFFVIEQPLLRTRGIFTAVGNHELLERGGREYLEYFGDRTFNYGESRGKLPQLNSTARWGNTRFFFLNAMTDWKAGADREWADAELTRAQNEPGLTWRIVVMHHGLFSAGPHGDNVKMKDAGIPALFKSKGIDLLLAGHDHLYERGYGEGLRYIVTGGGGAPLYEVRGKRPSTRAVESTRHFVNVTVRRDRVQIDTRRLDGSQLETCGFKKSEPDWDCDTALSAALGKTSASGQELSVKRVQNETPSAPNGVAVGNRCGCRTPPESGETATPAVCSFAALLAICAYRRRRNRP